MAAIAALLVSGCVTDHVIELELRPPRASDGGPDVPADVVAHELRVYRVDGGEGCPDLATAADAREFGAFAHAQSFDAADGMGEAIGELPRGTWAIAALSRAADCGVVLYGCAEATIGAEAIDRIVVDLVPSTDRRPRCGTCRSCELGTCAPVDALCP